MTMSKQIGKIHALAVAFLDENPHLAADLTVADVCHMIAAGCKTTDAAPMPEIDAHMTAQAEKMLLPFTCGELAHAVLGRKPLRFELLRAGRAARSVCGEPRKSNGKTIFDPVAFRPQS